MASVPPAVEWGQGPGGADTFSAAEVATGAGIVRTTGTDSRVTLGGTEPLSVARDGASGMNGTWNGVSGKGGAGLNMNGA